MNDKTTTTPIDPGRGKAVCGLPDSINYNQAKGNNIQSKII